MWQSIEALAEQYRAEAVKLDGLIARAKSQPNPDVFEQDRRMRILRSMRAENYDIYRHLLWYMSPDEK